MQPYIRIHTHTHTHAQTMNKQACKQWGKMLKAAKTNIHTHIHTNAHRGRQVLQHITGSAAHIGMDYHTVTLRLTPTDNKLQTGVHWGRRGVAAKEKTWGKSKRGRRNKQQTHCLMFPVCILCSVGSIPLLFL